MTPRTTALAPGPSGFPGPPVSGPEATAREAMVCCADHAGAECLPWPTGGRAAYELFVEGDDLYDAMSSSIAAAQQQVDLETYIYAADEVGWRLGKALAERARAGVQVRVLVDAAGSLFSLTRDLESYLRRQGVAVRRFHRWTWRQPLRFYRRNHRKLLVIDDCEAYLGGFNVHRESLRAAYGELRWRDTHARLNGSLAGLARGLFEAFWCGDRTWSARWPEELGDVLVARVTPGPLDGERTVIELGLSEGEAVIVQPSDLIRDGTRVKAMRKT